MPTTTRPDGYAISDDASLLDLDVIHRFLSEESYWSKGVPRAVVERSVANSLCLGVYQAGAQVGFTRIVTDKATFALLSDVFILAAHRGKGLSKWLIQSVLDHPDLQGLRRLLLLTSDAHGLYRQFGFTEIDNPWRFMEVARRDIYKSSAPG